MSILSHRDEFLELYKYSKNEEFKPSNPTKETDILGFTYVNKPNELEKEKNDKMKDFTEKELFMLSVMFNQMDYLLRVTNSIRGLGEEITINDLFDLACKLGVEKFMQ